MGLQNTHVPGYPPHTCPSEHLGVQSRNVCFLSSPKGASDECLWLRTVALSCALFRLQLLDLLGSCVCFPLEVSPVSVNTAGLMPALFCFPGIILNAYSGQLTLCFFSMAALGRPHALISPWPLLIALSVKGSRGSAAGFQDEILGMQLCPWTNSESTVSFPTTG